MPPPGKPSAVADPDPGDAQPDDVAGGESWRCLMFIELGYPELIALDLAHRRVDWHAVRALLAAGCPPGLAAEIAG